MWFISSATSYLPRCIYSLKFWTAFIGNTDFYNVRLDSDRYMSVMYKDPLPSDMGIMAGWDYLDDNSPTVELIPERNMETGIEEPARFSASSGLASCNAVRMICIASS